MIAVPAHPVSPPPTSLASNIHVPKLLGALDRVEKRLDTLAPVISSVEMGAPKDVDIMESGLQKAGIDLSVASTHAARAGLDELMEPLTGIAAALVGVSKLAKLEEGAFTFTPDIAPEVLSRSSTLHNDADELIGKIRTYIENDGKLPEEPPAETPPAETPPAETPPAETPPAETPANETPPAETPPAETPPAETPPAETPPAETPPTNGETGKPPVQGGGGELIGGPVPAREATKSWAAAPAMTINPDGTYKAQLATTDGIIGVELLPKIAPNAVNNFVFLAKEGFYDQTPIHRNIGDFMMQGGDPTGTGMGGPGYTIPDDPVPADMKYEKGVLAMANTGEPGSGGSQFFIMHNEVPLPPTYTIFGKVTEGMDVLDKIAARPVVENEFGEPSKPVDQIGIHGVTVTEG